MMISSPLSSPLLFLFLSLFFFLFLLSFSFLLPPPSPLPKKNKSSIRYTYILPCLHRPNTLSIALSSQPPIDIYNSSSSSHIRSFSLSLRSLHHHCSAITNRQRTTTTTFTVPQTSQSKIHFAQTLLHSLPLLLLSYS
ncbi:hypothetical protein K457DRAFT_237576 [Linnemannia elongata AG-77]|uniref:Uncharacterized protein n=1 Tax=Linnemannia elongata AG-77 TaxID=1314771 RepID=A0A197JFE9_9FUNG|nr:hypothetical protein K457DRAFT_237576 [Linnemannia elongata AG-77]